MSAIIYLVAAFLGAAVGASLTIWIFANRLKRKHTPPTIEFKETLQAPVTSPSKTGAKVLRDWEYRKNG